MAGFKSLRGTADDQLQHGSTKVDELSKVNESHCSILHSVGPSSHWTDGPMLGGAKMYCVPNVSNL